MIRSRAALAAAALALAACGSGDREDATEFRVPESLAEAPPTGVRVLIVGIDGATFDVIRPLASARRLPALRGLMERGSHAPLRSIRLSLSPAIWTTVATGHLPQTHGVDHFTSRTRSSAGRPALVTVHDRRTVSLWNIVSAARRSVDVVGWWVTWPAEGVRGHIVSDRVAHTRWESWTDDAPDGHLTWPPEYYEEIRGRVFDPASPPIEELEGLAPMTADERRELLEATEPIPFHWPSVLKFGWCEQRSYERIALGLWDGRQPDLAMLLLIAVDPVSHTTWHFYEPAAFRGVDAAEARRLGGLLPRVYEHDDRMLARLLQLVDEDTVVLVISDHGFRASGELPGEIDRVDLRVFGVDREKTLERPVNVGMTGEHARDGILIAAGGPIVQGARFESPPHVADITPTVLALLGLPVGEDMHGRVLTEMIDPEFLARHPVRTVASYEGWLDRPPLPEPGEDDAARRGYLKSLGYIDE